MIMIRESDIHKQMATHVAKIGRGTIMPENDINKDFEKFRERKKDSLNDPSQSMFKHENGIRGLPI